MRDFYMKWQFQTAQAATTVSGFVKNALANAGYFWMFYVGPVLTLPLIMLPRVLKDRRIRFLVIAGGVFAAALALDLWFYAHYAAPATALFYALGLQAMRHMRFCRRRQGSPGAFLVRAIPVICLTMVALRLAAQPLSYYLPPDHPETWVHTRPGNVDRAGVADRLKSLDGRHLAVIRYAPGHNWFAEWVYNEANIDGAKVVWAHDMGEDGNRELLEYFKARHVWLVEPDLKPPRVSPYPRQGAR